MSLGDWARHMATMAVAGLGCCDKGVLDGPGLVSVTCDLQANALPFLPRSFVCACVSVERWLATAQFLASNAQRGAPCLGVFATLVPVRRSVGRSIWNRATQRTPGGTRPALIF